MLFIGIFLSTEITSGSEQEKKLFPRVSVMLFDFNEINLRKKILNNRLV
jgi:hypothetical protein